MTIPELNERAAVLCGYPYTVAGSRVIIREVAPDGADFDSRPFDPATSPADCAVVMEAMDGPIDEDGWPKYNLVLDRLRDGYRAMYYETIGVSGPRDNWKWSCAPTWTHAVTLAAVRATEGESK